MKEIKKILVPTDLSELSLAGIDPASLLARTYGAEIILVHVIDVPPRFGFHHSEESAELMIQEEIDRAEKELQEFVRTRIVPTLQVRQIIRRGDAAREIVALSEQAEIDLIIIATHGRTGLVHTLLGSVAESVVRGARVPVMTVKPDYVREKMLESEDVEEQLHI